MYKVITTLELIPVEPCPPVGIIPTPVEPCPPFVTIPTPVEPCPPFVTIPTPVEPCPQVVIDPISPVDVTQGGGSWRVSLRKGMMKGISIRVDGPGAWAKLKGKSTFKMHKLESSKTYNKMQKNIKLVLVLVVFLNGLALVVIRKNIKKKLEKR
ncbi:hypothetical protein ACPUEJ_22810 [Vibrio tubiashii]|uniref:hypothetical protein n=1 Tax=Vibrio tubiashii TaxID=29498 RepID=UPI003CE55A8D